MVTSEAQEIKKQETLVRFSIVSYKTRLRVMQAFVSLTFCFLLFLSTYEIIILYYFITECRSKGRKILKEIWIFFLSALNEMNFIKFRTNSITVQFHDKIQNHQNSLPI